jgi:hypothetical protein
MQLEQEMRHGEARSGIHLHLHSIEQAVDKARLKAGKQVAKELDVKPKDIDRAIQQAASKVS